MRFPGLLWLGLAVALAWVAWVAWPRSAQPSVEAQHAASVEVKLGSVAHVVLASGWAQPKYKVDLGAQVSGQVETIHVAPGDSVQRGDLLLSLSTQLARNDLLQAQSNLGQQQAAMAIKRFERNQAQRDLERQRRLLAGQATTAAELEKAEIELARQAHALQSQSAMLERLKADVSSAKLKLSFARVLAPLDGEVVSIAAQVGQTINAQYQAPTLLSLAKLDVMTIRAQVPEAELHSVRKGQEASFRTLGQPEMVHRGVVQLIQPIPEKINGAVFYSVLFDVANPVKPDGHGRHLMPDMSGQVRLEVARVQDVPVLPMAALQARLPDGRFELTVQTAQAQAQIRQVRIGLSDAQQFQVLEGVQVGERVWLPGGALGNRSETMVGSP